MGKISDYTRVLAAKLADVFVVDQTDNGTTETKSATVEQIGTAIGTLQNFADLDTSNKNLVDAINEIASYTPVYGNTASGAIATFDTSLALPLQDCTIEINAVQESGTPTPSSPKLISGFTGANIKVDGKNLLKNIKTLTASTVVTLGQTSASTYETFLKKGTYTISFERVGGAPFGVFYAYDGSGGISLIASSSPDTSATFTLDHDDYYRFWIYKSGGVATTDIDNYMIEVGNQPTEYEVYNDTTTAITWQDEAGTVYGGSLKVYGNGTVKLPVTHGGILLDGSQGESAFAVTTYTDYTRVEWLGYRNIGIIDPVFMSDKFEFISGIPQEVYKIGGSSGGVRCWLCLPTTITTKAEANTWFSNNPTFVRYPLATPVEYTLTGIPPIYSIAGTNNVFGDTNGDTSVVYACSLKDYIDSQ